MQTEELKKSGHRPRKVTIAEDVCVGATSSELSREEAN